MNVEQALNAASESDAEGLRGLYPTAAQVLAEEVRHLRGVLAKMKIHKPSGAVFDEVIACAFPEDVTDPCVCPDGPFHHPSCPMYDKDKPNPFEQLGLAMTPNT